MIVYLNASVRRRSEMKVFSDIKFPRTKEAENQQNMNLSTTHALTESLDDECMFLLDSTQSSISI
jgi:hypothetical protein